MGMFDYYEPRPPLACPRCGAGLDGWQGKSGPCALLQWVQGERAPRRQLVDEDVSLSSPGLAGFALPDDFELYLQCGSCGGWIEAQGSCDAGVWARTDLTSPLEPPGLSDQWMLLQHDDRGHHLAELRREVTAGHVLHGCRLLPLARRRDRDDVLLRVVGAVAPLWVVHLTWRAETNPSFPSARPFADLAALAATEEAEGG